MATHIQRAVAKMQQRHALQPSRRHVPLTLSLVSQIEFQPQAQPSVSLPNTTAYTHYNAHLLPSLYRGESIQSIGGLRQIHMALGNQGKNGRCQGYLLFGNSRGHLSDTGMSLRRSLLKRWEPMQTPSKAGKPSDVTLQD